MKRKLFCLCLSLALLAMLWPVSAQDEPEESVPEPPAASQPAEDSGSQPTPPPEPESPPVPEETPVPLDPPSASPSAPPTPAPETAGPSPSPEPGPSQEPQGTPAASTMPSVSPAPSVSPDPSASPSPSESPAPDEEPPVIRVSVPNNGRVIVNPYGMSVNVAGTSSTDQIIHQAQSFTNLGETPVLLTATAFGELPEGSHAVFVTAPPPRQGPQREAFVYVEFQNDPAGWSGSYTGAANQLLVTPEGQWKDQVLRLEPEAQGYFRLFGAASAPSSPMWTASDTIGVRLVFDFTCVEPPPVPDETPAPQAPPMESSSEETA